MEDTSRPLPEGKKQRLVVNVPTHDMIPYSFAFDFANMIGYTVAMLGDELDIVTNVVPGTYIHKARQQLIDGALEMGCNWILWLDSDMRFPKDALVRLMMHNEDIVGVNYSTRQIPPRYVAIKQVAMEDPNRKGALCPTREDSTGLEEVGAIGFGVVLMKAAFLKNMPPRDDGMWFWFKQDEKSGAHIGEDVYFCVEARKAGAKVYVDHDLSKEIAHIGQMEYRLEHAAEFEAVNADLIPDYYEYHGIERPEEDDGADDVQRATDGDSELVESE